MNPRFIKQAVTLILLGFGIFQVLAALFVAFFLIIHADWTEFIPQIVGIAFWLTLPVAFVLWNKAVNR
ncbi:MAG: hypothetical protein JXA13_03505 [Anaerolineales bacterium]|nr:hypothetical protein [Anaerolineales bacterium]